jgi:hypothetical protein
MHIQSHAKCHGNGGAVFGNKKNTSRRSRLQRKKRSFWEHDSQLAALLGYNSSINSSVSKSARTTNLSPHIPTRIYQPVNPSPLTGRIACQFCSTVLFNQDQQIKHYFEPIQLGPANRTAAAYLGLYMDMHNTIPRCSALGTALRERTFDSRYEATFWFDNFKQTTRSDF